MRLRTSESYQGRRLILIAIDQMPQGTSEANADCIGLTNRVPHGDAPKREPNQTASRRRVRHWFTDTLSSATFYLADSTVSG